MIPYITPTGAYYEAADGMALEPADIVVPQRPDPSYAWSGTAWVINPAAVHAALAVQAQTALDKSDTTVVRCTSAGVAVPAAWQTFRTALRAIVSGADTTSTALPAVPAYPAGT